MKIAMIMMVLAVSLGGCGGYFSLVAGDHVAPAGGETPVVARLLRNDFFFLNLAEKGSLLRFRVADGLECGAYTDDKGYAGTMVPVAVGPGRHPLYVDHLDFREGEEVAHQAAMYVIDRDRPVVAIDADTLPAEQSTSAGDATRALAGLAQRAEIVYLTSESTSKHPAMHERFDRQGYPDGAILRWRREYWRVDRSGRFRWPRVVVESRMVSLLPELREVLPKLSVGLCGSQLAAEAFAGAGIQPIIVGQDDVEAVDAKRFESWAQLAEQGLQLP